jgi:parallel beta-helix repeat protein
MGKGLALVLVLICLILLVTLPHVTVKAVSNTIIVPDDYPTISAAIGNATNGNMILIRSGSYLESSLTIDKTVSLIGENAQNTIIHDIDQPTMYLGSALLAGPNAVTVKANNVVISLLTIVVNNTGADILGNDVAGGGVGTQILNSNLPDGITLSSGSYQLISQNIIGEIVNHFAIVSGAPYTYITNNTIKGGVKVQNSYGSGPFNNVIYANSITTTTYSYDWQAWGINIYMSQWNLIAKNNITNSRAGIVSDLSSYNTITGNTIVNGYIGLAAIQGGGGDTFFGNNIVNNSYSLVTAGYNDTFYDNNFINNAQQIGSPDMLRGPNPSAITLWYKGTQGNYWSNYAGLDRNGDGIGDTPYVIDTNNIDTYPLMAPFNLTTVTLPDWASNISQAALPLTFPTLAPTSAPTATPTTSPAPTSAPITTPTASSPLISSSPFPMPTVPEFPTLTIPLLLIVMLVAGLLVYFKKRKRLNTVSSQLT